MTVRIIHGDCRTMLAMLADQSVQCVVTSPPYFGLRDYGVDGQIGLEATPATYVAEMVAVFREIWRVLRDDGVCWLNLGDSYAGSWGAQGRRETDSDNPTWHSSQIKNHPKRASGTGSIRQAGLKPKDLMGIPWRVAFALQDDGWYLRRDVIWSKPNPMPESCMDRPATAHEYVFLLTKSARYFYDAEAVREDRVQDEDAPTFRGGAYVRGQTDNGMLGKRTDVGNKRVKIPGGWKTGLGSHGSIHDEGRTSAKYQEAVVSSGRNLRSVWTIATAPFADAHFATFPPKLAETCILAGTSEKGCCAACGAPWARTITKGEPDDAAHRAACGADASGGYTGQSTKGHDAAGIQNASDLKRRILEGMREKTYGWVQTCGCTDATVVPCVVLDPFGGAGTVGLVADRLGRSAILIELKAEYVEMARRRMVGDAPLFAEVIG